PGVGDAVFQRVCAACHLSVVQTSNANPGKPLESKALPREILRNLPPGAILNALTNGKMQAQGSTLSVAERRAVAEYVTGKSLAGAAAQTEKPNECTEARAMRDPASGPAWNGWGNGPANDRRQSKAQGGLTAADLPSARTQPTLAGGRLFVASDNGEVHALDPGTGCSYWKFKAQAGVSSAPMVGKYRSADSKSGFAVY